MYKEKFGEARIAQMLPHMTKTFAELGVHYSIGGLTGSTLDSHRLIHWAGEVGGASAQDAVVSELFNNYFSEVSSLQAGGGVLGDTWHCGIPSYLHAQRPHDWVKT